MTSVTAQGNFDLGDLVRQHQAGVWRYLRFLGCDVAESDDLVQETFLAVAKKPFEVRTRRESAAYLRTVARNLLLGQVRKRGRRPVEVDLEAVEIVWAAAAGDSGLDDYLEALSGCLQSALGDEARRAIDLQYGQSASRIEIAERLNMTAEGVKTLLRRARASLRKCVERKLHLTSATTNGRDTAQSSPKITSNDHEHTRPNT